MPETELLGWWAAVTAERLDQDTDRTVSDVIVACLAGPQSFAEQDPADGVATDARALVEEALGIHAHWDTTSPVAARTIVKAHMRRRHPEVTEEALEALATHCTLDFQR